MECRDPMLHLLTSVSLGSFAPIVRILQGPFSRRSRMLIGSVPEIVEAPLMSVFILIIALVGGLSILGALSILVSVRCRAVETHRKVLLEARRIRQQRLQRLHDRHLLGEV